MPYRDPEARREYVKRWARLKSSLSRPKRFCLNCSKPMSNFGLKALCSDRCVRERKAWQARKDYHNKDTVEYRKKNRESIRANSRKYLEKNREKIRRKDAVKARRAARAYAIAKDLKLIDFNRGASLMHLPLHERNKEASRRYHERVKLAQQVVERLNLM